MRNLTHLAGRLYNAAWLIEASKFEMIEHVFREHLGKHADMFDEDEDNALDCDPAKPYMVDDDGIAVIRILGTTVRRATGMRAMSGMTSYTKLSSDFAAAVNDADVKAIMIDVDSGGGEAGGCFDLGDQIHAARGAKPVWACANESMFSAAYALGSAADRIILSRTAGVGSIGVVSMHTDQSKAIADAGLKVKFIKFGDCKVDGNSAEPLSTRAEESMQAEVDRIGEIFVASVARNRGMSAKAVRDTQAALFYGPDAVDAGLADKIGTFAEAMNDLRALIGADPDAEVENEDEAGGPLVNEDDDREVKPVAGVQLFGMRRRTNSKAPEIFVRTLPKWGAPHDILNGSLSLSFGRAMISEQSGRQRITGCPIPYNKPSGDLGGIREIYAPGCFTASLQSEDYRLLINHNADWALGRKSANNTVLFESPTGVHLEANLIDTTYACDLVKNMRAGILREMSAAFYILNHRWETRGQEKFRVIEKAKIVEVSIATFPAYDSTSVEALEVTKQAQSQNHNGLLRARLELLKYA